MATNARNFRIGASETYVPEIKCQFGNKRCLCQWCEKPCNNGLQCHECAMAKKQMHDTFMCTGFDGTYPEGYTSDYIHKKAEILLKHKDVKNHKCHFCGIPAEIYDEDFDRYACVDCADVDHGGGWI